MSIFDAVVIGGGPAGLTAALYLVRGGLTTALIEKATDGGQVLSTAEIENYPGFPQGIAGWELADKFSEHLNAYPVERIRGSVSSIDGADGMHVIRMSDNAKVISARTVVIATGARHSKLGLADEERLTGKGVSYCAVCDGNFYRGLDVAVVGGGNSALEESLYLSRIASHVTLIHRRDAFRGAKVYADKLESMGDKVELVRSSVIESLEGQDALAAVHVRNVTTGEVRRIPADGLFIYVGNVPNADFVPAGVERDGKGFIVTDQEMRTAVPGIFAAGDIRVKGCRQVSSAVGDGATAATSAIAYLEQLHA
ncbi:MAG: FAD-dependent oxidoreductase [Mailhella sp.]|nr:FAD-dependent oxidoreductase [Mailhella sp.]